MSTVRNFLLSMLASVAHGSPIGINLPASYQEIAKHRFQSPKSYDDTKKDFVKLFQSSKMKLIGEEINLPQVRVISYKNYEKNSNLLGVNIYLNMQTGLTEVFFLSK